MENCDIKTCQIEKMREKERGKGRKTRRRRKEEKTKRRKKKKYWLRSLINIVEKLTQTLFTTKMKRCFDIQNCINKTRGIKTLKYKVFSS